MGKAQDPENIYFYVGKTFSGQSSPKTDIFWGEYDIMLLCC